MNKYIKEFREAVQKLDEVNAATKHFAYSPQHIEQTDMYNFNGMSEVIDKFNDTMITIMELQSFVQELPEAELKSNSQMARIAKQINALYQALPERWNADSGMENDYGANTENKAWMQAHKA